MKKDKKWIHKEVDKLRIYTNPDIPTRLDDFYGQYLQYVSGVNSTAEEVLGLIKQLDEPEVLSQEWIRDNQERKGVHFFVNVTKLQNLVVSKKELPVIPKYVAEYINLVKIDIPLMKILAVANRRNELPEWKKEYDWISANDEMFARAWLNGYTVEAEPLYYAMVKGHELLDDSSKYWSHNKYDSEDFFISYNQRDDSPIIVKNTKSRWLELGINDSNADFVKVKENE